MPRESFGLCAGEGAPLSESDYLAYQTSKAALNMATVFLAKKFADTPLVITAISPGWCRTEMGGAEAPRSAREGDEVIYHAAFGIVGWGRFFAAFVDVEA
jgi:NAD(P)-dependent dehydrogenase (short-subunit alcohol dehydrogenase family)